MKKDRVYAIFLNRSPTSARVKEKMEKKREFRQNIFRL